jgi:hypothetical protein
VILALAAALALGQAPRPAPPVGPEPGAALTVTLLTFETGELVWERFGHNAIWIHDAATGADALYDYGRFSFGHTTADLARFIFNFARGRMWYSMGETADVAFVVDFYAKEGRKIWAQELDLPPLRRKALQDFLQWNIQPEHAGYAYDYYRDNCSTRIRDAIDRALGGALGAYGAQPSSMTWREETRRLDEHNVLLYTGLMTGLGRPVDRVMSRWEQMFLPIRLREHLDSVTVAGADGARHPAVRSERVLAEGGRWPVPARPSNWTFRYLFVGLLLGGVLAWLGRPGAIGDTSGSGGGRRWAFLALATLWELLAGVAGLILTWLWVFSAHVVAHDNENLLLFNLFALALAVMLPSAVRGKRWAAKPARRLALLVAALAALGLLLKALPAFRQSNIELIALALPVHLGVWLGLSSSPRPS